VSGIGAVDRGEIGGGEPDRLVPDRPVALHLGISERRRRRLRRGAPNLQDAGVEDGEDSEDADQHHGHGREQLDHAEPVLLPDAREHLAHGHRHRRACSQAVNG
jgi:hypothetical protein